MIDERAAGDMLINAIAEDRNIIPYRKSLRALAGSVTSTILLQQIIFRSQNHDDATFYKFRAPCSHELYRPGDSWTEELGFSVKEFDAALAHIATKITRGKSKFEVMDSTDAKSLVLYWTDASRVTWYMLNRDLLGKCLKGIYLVSDQRESTWKAPKGDLPVRTETTSETTAKRGREGASAPRPPAQATPVELPSRKGKDGKLHFKSPHVDSRHFDRGTGYIRPGAGASAVEVYYERFDVQQNDARLTSPQEDDLVRLCPDLDKLRAVVTAYSRAGFKNPRNVQLILDWYQQGVPDKHREVAGTQVASNGYKVAIKSDRTKAAFEEVERKFREQGLL